MFALCRIGFCFVRETPPGNLNYHNIGLAQTVASVENFNLFSGNNRKYMWSSSSLDRKMNHPCATSMHHAELIRINLQNYTLSCNYVLNYKHRPFDPTKRLEWRAHFHDKYRHINSKKNCREHHMSPCCNSWWIALGSRNEGPHFLVVRFSASVTVSVSVSIKIVLFL
jgi:hypothetical protein